MVETRVFASRRFTSDDQIRFARVSGDWNPMHTDVVAARRTAAGAPVVHGVHLLLWMADRLGSDLLLEGGVVTVVAHFSKWVYVGDLVELVLVDHGHDEVRTNLVVNGLVVTTANFGLGERERGVAVESTNEILGHASVGGRVQAAEIDFGEVGNQSGFVDFASTVQSVAGMFPGAVSWLGEIESAGLACSTRLVGMVCPGLHSIFAGLRVEFSDGASRALGISYEVVKVDERFRSVTMKVSGAGLSGTLNTFSRAPPVLQAAIASISELVERKEFAGSRALIVGGSRGLGEFCAKVIAAGGGKVTITYAVGKTDAERVANEIRAWGGECDVLAYDVLRQGESQMRLLTEAPTTLYYFATAMISKPRSRKLDFGLMEMFTEFYVKGFYQACDAHKAVFGIPLRVFYPSTVFVDSCPEGMAEYAMVKAAGEVMCNDMRHICAGVEVLVRRLPRMLTDQTASIVPIKRVSMTEVMLPIVREMEAGTVE